MAGHGSRKTLLFVNEVSVDLWPTSPLGAIAEAVAGLAREQEFDVSIVFALRDPVFAGHPIAARGHHVVPSPATPMVVDIGTQANSFTDVLLSCRFARAQDLSRAASAWEGLFAIVRPDVIIADTSPVVMLAARGRVPVMITGSGFAVPPAGLTLFPPLGEKGTDDALQQRMLEVANAVLKARDAATLDHLPQVLEGEARAALSFPKLDPYADLRSEPALRPCGSSSPLPLPAAPLLFVHMGSDHPSAGAVVRGLDRSGIAVAGYIPGPASAPTAFLEALGAELHESLPSQAEILSRTSIVVGGDVWLAQAAYASGRPQICLPTSLETRLLGARLQQLGCGIALRRFSAGELASAVRELMLDPVYRKRAEEEAHGVAEIPPEGESARIVARRCLELANR